MPKYRVKSGVIRLKKNGAKRSMPVRANDVVELTPETATKYKQQLLPMSPDAIFIDEMDEYSEIASRDVNMVMVPVEGEKGFFNVLNTITNQFVNSTPLSGKDAMKLIKGTNVVSVFNEYQENGIKNINDFEDVEEIEEEKEEEVEVGEKEKPKKKKTSKSKDKKKESKDKKKKKKTKE